MGVVADVEADLVEGAVVVAQEEIAAPEAVVEIAGIARATTN